MQPHAAPLFSFTHPTHPTPPQDQVVRRTLAMLEGKAGQLMRMLADVDGAAQMREEEARTVGEQQLGAFVKVRFIVSKVHS